MTLKTFWRIFMFIILLVSLFMFTSLKIHFQKYIIHYEAKDSYAFTIYIINDYFNK